MPSKYRKFVIQSVENTTPAYEYDAENTDDALSAYTFERGEFVEELLRIEHDNRVTFDRATGRVIAQIEWRTV